MALRNTPRSYGLIARILHWLTALLILTAFPLGFLANRTELTDGAAIERVFALFSLHKTVGIAALLIGLLRIVWTLTQTRPGHLSHARWERTLSAVTHWTLSVALMAVPLTGWLAHSAAPGLAPIRWPFGQSLPFVPTSAEAAAIAGGVHWLATKLLAVAILLHVAGALKHAVLDRDGTLARMVSGARVGDGRTRTSGPLVPMVAAAAIWALAIGFGVFLGQDRAAQLAVAPPPAWNIVSGTVAIGMDNRENLLGVVQVWDANLNLDTTSRDAPRGTFDMFVALDSIEGDDASLLLDRLVIPILQFTGTIEGTLPVVGAAGILDVGGQTSEAGIVIETDAGSARIYALLPIPGTPEFLLTLDITATAP